MQKNKKQKLKLTFTYYNPNTEEEMRELLKNIIIKILINRKENKSSNP